MTLPPLFSAAVALAVVVGLILLIGRLASSAKFVRRNGRLSGRMSVVEQLNLDPKRRLLLVRCDGRSVLLLTGQQDQVVGWLPDQPA